MESDKKSGLPIPRELLIEILSKFGYFKLLELGLVSREFNIVIQNTTGGLLAKMRFRERPSTSTGAIHSENKAKLRLREGFADRRDRGSLEVAEQTEPETIPGGSQLSKQKDEGPPGPKHRFVLHPCLELLKIKYLAIKANKLSINDVGFVSMSSKVFRPLTSTFAAGENAVQSAETFANRENPYPGPYLYCKDGTQEHLNKLTVEDFVKAYLSTNIFALSYFQNSQQDLLDTLKAMAISNPNRAFVSPTDFSEDPDCPNYRTLLRHPRESETESDNSGVRYRRHAVELRLKGYDEFAKVAVVIDRCVAEKGAVR